MKRSDIGERTIADFGAQWGAFTDNDGYYASTDLLLDVVHPFMRLDDFKGATIADIGSGTGRFVRLLLSVDAKHVYAVEPSAAFDVLRGNLSGHPPGRVALLNIKGEDLPADLGLDLVFSYGVIHHIPDPLPTMRAAFAALRPGGRCCIWIYGYEGNESYVAVVRQLRAITTRLPDWALRMLCHFLNFAARVYITACRYISLPLRDYALNVLARLEPRRRYLVIFDQLNPAYAKYYRKEEVRALFEAAGFVNIKLHHRHSYSWTVLGERPQ